MGNHGSATGLSEGGTLGYIPDNLLQLLQLIIISVFGTCQALRLLGTRLVVRLCFIIEVVGDLAVNDAPRDVIHVLPHTLI